MVPSQKGLMCRIGGGRLGGVGEVLDGLLRWWLGLLGGLGKGLELWW